MPAGEVKSQSEKPTRGSDTLRMRLGQRTFTGLGKLPLTMISTYSHTRVRTSSRLCSWFRAVETCLALINTATSLYRQVGLCVRGEEPWRSLTVNGTRRSPTAHSPMNWTDQKGVRFAIPSRWTLTICACVNVSSIGTLGVQHN